MTQNEIVDQLKELALATHSIRLSLDFAAAENTTIAENGLLDLRKTAAETLRVVASDATTDAKFEALNKLDGGFRAANLQKIINEKELEGYLSTIETIRSELGEA